MPEFWLYRYFEWLILLGFIKYKDDNHGSSRKIRNLPKKRAFEGVLWFHNCITHALSLNKPTVVEAETDKLLDDLRDRLCENIEALDRLTLGLKVSTKELQDLGYIVVKTEAERASLVLPENQQVIVSGSQGPKFPTTPSPLIVAVRGKELVLAFKNYAIRVSFATQGHCFWIPNQDFESMIENGAESFTAKGKSYPLPVEYQSASKGQQVDEKRHVRIAMSVKGPTHTLIFVDHNMLLRFHILKFKTALTAQDLVPDSEAWPLLWGKNHGPDAVLEREAWLAEYDAWIGRIQQSSDPLLRAFLNDKKVSNGWGEWQGTDVVARASLHPAWTASRFADCAPAVARFKQALITMAEVYNPQIDQPTSTLPFKTIFQSEGSPYDFIDYAHQDWITKAVFVYRKATANVSPAELEILSEQGLLNPYHVINSNGIGVVPEGSQPSPAVEKLKPRLRVFKFQLGSKTYYTHIEAIPEELLESVERTPVTEDKDLRHSSSGNTPTLGPYSFQIFHSGRQTTRASTVGRPPLRVTSSGSASRRTAPTAQSSARYKAVPSTSHTTYEERLKRKRSMQEEVDDARSESAIEEEQTEDSEDEDRRRPSRSRLD